MTTLTPRFPILTLLHPRQYRWLALGALITTLVLWFTLVGPLRRPIWVASAAGLLLLLAAATFKWRDDLQRYGPVITLLSVLLAAQAFHTFEHVAQIIQYHILQLPAAQSGGLLSPANAEWVHFVWNWLVVILVVILVRGGMRNIWAWLLLTWACAHALEHSYMMARYLMMLQEFERLGVSNISAQGLPGILGRDGWLARSPSTQGSFLCRLPGLATAPRIDVHFWWNVGEVLLLLAAAHVFLKQRLQLSHASE